MTNNNLEGSTEEDGTELSDEFRVLVRPFGPSNYMQRPNTSKTIIYKHPSGPDVHDGKLAAVICQPIDQMREQAILALSWGYSPDSLWGIVDYLGGEKEGQNKQLYNKEDRSTDEWVRQNGNIILEGIRRFAHIPADYIRNTNQAAEGLKYGKPEKLSRLYEEFFKEYMHPGPSFKAEVYGQSRDTWRQIRSMLNVVATYEDEQMRKPKP